MLYDQQFRRCCCFRLTHLVISKKTLQVHLRRNKRYYGRYDVKDVLLTYDCCSSHSQSSWEKFFLRRINIFLLLIYSDSLYNFFLLRYLRSKSRLFSSVNFGRPLFLLLPNVRVDLSSNFKYIMNLLVRIELSFTYTFYCCFFRSFAFSFLNYWCITIFIAALNIK